MSNNIKRNGNERNFRKNGAEILENENLIIGRNAVKELLASGRDIDKVFVARGEREGSISALIAEISEKKIPIVEVEKRKLDAMCANGRHQGIIAFAAERNYSTIDDILKLAEEKSEKPFIIICDGIEDPHNLGAVIRTAECCGAHGIIIQKRRSVGLTAVVARASAGALEHMKIAKVVNISSAIEELKEKGVWIYAADMDGENYSNTDFKSAAALVLGSEGFGISKLVKERCDFTVSIPMYGRVNSLNVSNAGAILMAEVAKQRHE